MEQINSQKNKQISLRKASFYCLIIFILAFAAGFFLERNIFSKIQEKEGFVNYSKNSFEGLFGQVETYIKKNYIKQPIEEEALYYGALKGLVRSLNDPYSVFFDPQEMSKFLEEMSGEFEGVGMEIGIKKDVLTIIAPLPDTPAEKAGFKPGDKIYAIDKKSTAGMSAEEAASLIRGRKGASVVLTIWREGWDLPKDFEVVRDRIKIKIVEWEKKENGVVYLKISHFSDNTWSEFKKAAGEILKAKPKALIFDLRNNPGGYLETAVDVAGYWLGQDVVTFSENVKGERKEYRANGRGEFASLKTIILINKGSASGAEILAGALKDYKKAVLIGETTFGKGSIQEMETYSDGSGLKLTVAYWYTPNNTLINDSGIKPDIEVLLSLEDFDKDKDPQLQRALEEIKSLNL
ncbi:hypothetical protein COW09_00210 [bacterium (Candidatus Moisslbacteria) CG12_big_fil_rev_8_21_14_0_65_36_11]|nr:S41 family peptidase [Candidatus Kuenenbacteria bacterium]OIP76384.1 MAG: hypothetical protein AUK09_02165 [Parcubacteria group bacterium CG2_30_36_38]PIV45977.1 MAG: hypothetical protein COS23_01515 [bacterium (Candidatus Moisslbacteria) CG02_land_8_20_14_3_00_36_53]PIW68115.1 MAG: hypothetical protein COW09_00210 [bacterium (Candidatus Moisslbacteria) CG12_big_fil_rev_8_21_14_0_65_36_11]PIZ90450.1 MAG: hypothetical protein COX87_00265 [bacterium (Candidatus Moisslbacteria) CG_4_10_14_0_2_u